MRLKKYLKRRFTLIELLVAMAVFAVLMSVLMQFFSSAQKVYTSTAGKTEMFENARIAMNMIARDLQSIYYNQDTQTYFRKTEGASGAPDELSMVTTLSSVPNEHCSSRVAEVTYKLNTSDDMLQINVTGDHDKNDNDLGGNVTSAWNFALQVSNPANPFSTIDSSFGASGWQEIIPYVMDFQVVTITKDGTLRTSFPYSQYDKLPYLVRVDLTLLDRDSYAKWKASGNDDIRDNNKRTFSKMVIIDRGQYP